ITPLLNFVTRMTKAKKTKIDLCHRRDRIRIDEFILFRWPSTSTVGVLHTQNPSIVFERLERFQYGLAWGTQSAVDVAHRSTAAAGTEQSQHPRFQPPFFVFT